MIALTLICWLGAFFAAASAIAQNACSPEVTLEFKSVAIDRAKGGFEAFVQLNPPKIQKFKKLEDSFDESVQLNLNGNVENGRDTAWHVRILDPANGQYLQTDSGHISVSGTDACEADLADPGHPDCYLSFTELVDRFRSEWGYAFDNQEACATTSTDDSPATPTRYVIRAGHYILSCPGRSGFHHFVSLRTLSDEYRTDEWIGRVKTDLQSMTYPTDWSETGEARMTIDPSETELTASKTAFRFQLRQTEKEVAYVIRWDEVTVLDNGSTWIRRMEEEIEGNGHLTRGREHETLPPGQNGRTTVENVSVRLRKHDPHNVAGAGGPGVLGAGSCVGCSTESSGAADIGVSLSLSPGQAKSGQAAGRLWLSQSCPSPSLAQPILLSYSGNRSDVAVVRTDQGLRQIRAPQAVADIVTIDPFKYEIRFYLPSQSAGAPVKGVYPMSGSPFVTWTIENPDASATIFNRLRVREIRGDSSREFNYAFNSANGNWKLTYPGGIREDEIISVSQGGNRQQIQLIRDGSGNVIQRIAETYRMFPWGEALIEIKEGDDPNPKTTTQTYSDQGFASGNVLPLEQIIHPDGSWERFEYDDQGRKTAVYSAFRNQAPTWDPILCRRTTYSYTPAPGSGDDGTTEPYTPRTVVESLLGQEISRRYRIIKPGEKADIQCQTAGAPWDADDNLVTVTRYYLIGEQAGSVQSVKNPDGTMVFYEYASQSGGTRRTTVSRGQPNSAQSAIINGTRTMTLTGDLGQMLSETVVDIASNAILDSETYSNFDEFKRPRRITYLDGTFTEMNAACCGIDDLTDRDGTATQYAFDALKRQVASTRNNLTFTNVLDAAGRVLVAKRIGSDGSEIRLHSATYDSAGRLTSEVNALNGTTSYLETLGPHGGLVKTSVYPDGGVRVETYARDGSLLTVTGSATHPVRYEYGVENEGGIPRAYTKEIKLDASGADTAEWTKTFTDLLGRTYKTVFAAAAGTPAEESFYNRQGQLEKQVDPDGVVTLSQYNAKGELEFTAVDLNRNGTIDFGGTDRITQVVSDVVANYGTMVRRTRTFGYPANGSSTALLLDTTEVATTGLKTWQTRIGLTSRTEISYDRPKAYRYVTETPPDRSSIIRVFRYGRLESVRRKDAGGIEIGRTTYGYDPHGRLQTMTEPRTGSITYVYNEADQVTTVTTRPPGNDPGSQSTTTSYNAMLQPWQVIQPDGSSVTREYLPTGALKRNFGARAYPAEFSYDAQGHLKTLTTWSSFASGAGARVTTWNYDPYRGWLSSKRYPDDAGPDYAYTPAGRLAKRIWARGNPRLVTSFGYDNAGDLQSVAYSDGATPGLVYTTDRLGRLTRVDRESGSTRWTYNAADQVLAESYSGGTLHGLAVTNAYDALLRRTAVALNAEPVTLTTFAYDNASRLQSVVNGTFSATNAFLANSSLLEQTVFKQGSTVRLTTTRKYDHLNRLTSISNATPSAGVSSHAYQYNDANQRIRATLLDQSYWSYEYDALGQLKSGKKFWNDGAPTAGEQFEYVHDDIGNRLATRAGGDATGGGLRTASYTPNSLNQYVNRTVPGAFDVWGIGNGAATITVNGQPASRRNEFYHAVLLADNQAGPVFQPVRVEASLDGKSVSQSGQLFLPQNPENFGYDLDGNLTSDGRWTYTWDAENRLIKMEARPDLPDAAKKKLEFEYDHQGRRIRKTVSTWNPSTLTYQPSTDTKYLYDGWNLLAELDTDNRLIRSYVWGLDLSGTMQGAGGVGGLLAVKPAGGSHHCPAYDGNGNVMALIDTASATASAQYEYGPFGELLRVTGPMGKANPLTWSTKYTDAETGLACYGYRFYAPGLGRWLGHDPIEELGGLNLLGFLHNSPMDSVDYLGLWGVEVHRFRTWRLLISEKYRVDSADRISEANNGVDGMLSGTSFLPSYLYGEQSYHFNRHPSGVDSRLERHMHHFDLAKQACDKCRYRDEPELAAMELGIALHPLQDYFAHGDFGTKTSGNIVKVHNSDSPQQGYGDVSSFPDNPVLDAVNGRDGRPAGAAMHYAGSKEWALFVQGSKRMTATERKTRSTLQRFRTFIRTHGSCGCKLYFFLNE